MLKLQNFNHLMPKVTHLKRPWCWERLKATGEGGSRGWDGWMASPTQWTWIWANSRTQWGTGKPGILQSVGLQRVGHDWVTEQQQNKYLYLYKYNVLFYSMFFKLMMMSICGSQPRFYLKKKVKQKKISECIPWGKTKYFVKLVVLWGGVCMCVSKRYFLLWVAFTSLRLIVTKYVFLKNIMKRYVFTLDQRKTTTFIFL